MTEDEALGLATKATAEEALKQFAKVEETERRKLRKPIAELWKAYWRAEFSITAEKTKRPSFRDLETLRVAMLATATPPELKPYGFHILPSRLDVVEVMRALSPSWLDRYVSDLIDGSAHLVWQVAPIWRAGLCARPETDSLIFGYYSHIGGHRFAEEEPDFASRDIWRFFEVEGGGELSLAAHDKYTPTDGQWMTTILAMARVGKLDRQRLLDASLDALERDFGQFRVGWYARLHTALEPTQDEQAARAARYLRLLASPIPPTVSFALKTLKSLDKAGQLGGDALLAELGPPLQARQKSTVATALQLLASAVRKAPGHAAEAARLAATALISEATDVQAKALDFVERLDAVHDPEVEATLAAHLDAVAPSLRPRLAAMLGADAPEPDVEATCQVSTETPIATPVRPVGSVEEAVALFLQVLETCRDPVEVERAIDGIARFGAAARVEGDKLSPVAKRSRQLLERAGDVKLRTALAATGVAWAEGESIATVLERRLQGPSYLGLTENSLIEYFAHRTDEILANLREGAQVPLLSLPSDNSGQIAPVDLVERLGIYRSAALPTPQKDLALALLRLGPAGREEAFARLQVETEADRAVAFALGGSETPGVTTELWVAAWAARSPETADAKIAKIVGGTVPAAGTPANLSLTVEREGKPPYFWCVAKVEIAPKPVPATKRFLSSSFLNTSDRRYGMDNPCGYSFEDIAWASIVWPGQMEPFFACAIKAMDTDQKLTDHFGLAYLEPLLRPGAGCGPMAHGMLAFYLASADRS
ncbi:MAG: DUF6493 family protein, partial [Pseudomonadota bacterium]